MAAGLSAPARRWRRWLGALALLLAVSLGHAWLTLQLLPDGFGWGEGERPPARMEVAFVRELRPTTPPTVPSPPPPARRSPTPVAPGASQPLAMEPPLAPAEPAAAPDAVVLAPAEASRPTPDAATPASAAASAPLSQENAAYDWLPPSTQLSYRLHGDVNGPVEGSAQVRWIRQGAHYQVHIDTRVALVVSRRMTSDGELTPHGLRPRRYDEETETLVTAPRRVSVHFELDRLQLANGQFEPRPEGVQDTASQLVQLVWLFTTQPQRLSAGGRVELPLALPRRVDRWVYDVLPAEPVATPFGEIEAVPIKPRRPARPGNVLTVQSWFAPTLQYLPVKLRIEQSEAVYVELLLERAPLQAAPAP